MQSLITDPGVAKYRQLELTEAIKIVEEIFKDNEHDINFVNGALFMLKKILHIPHLWGTSKEAKEATRNMIARDLKEFHSRYMRLFLE